ncbi:glycerophosphodiester phosphodiesterase [Georgenia sp. TF02-10]|uniref:glycerophosphodiester phosphodiesterase n=1 Tax=Georgenia sp. TF02-10 TaxID=2917725 RepID=UPI001FA819E0|nr:glycerophosphodiester phosphodiesterase [Georgenia sp. TF02-10]UNX53991.1 glycerophosphodiester phosphodiesterase [Georgenia sp. TF02-10]
MPYLDGVGPIALAHRGGAQEVPENSRAAVEHVRALGLGYLETDVHATADGVVVLSHDPTVDRVTDGSGALAAMTWRQVAVLRDRSGDRLVRLDELLADYPELRVNIDAKSDAVVDPLVATVRDAGAVDRVCLTSFAEERLARVRAALGPAVATGLGRADVLRLVAAARLPGPAQDRALRQVPGPAAGTVCVQVPVRYRRFPVVTPAFIAAAHRHGLAVHVWTVDEPGEMCRLLDMGVDGLVSDRPTLLRDVLTARGPWH